MSHVPETNANLEQLTTIIQQRIADLEESLLTEFDYTVVGAVNQLYELLNNLRWGGQIPPAEPVVVSVDDIPQLESLVNDVVRTIERQRNNAK